MSRGQFRSRNRVGETMSFQTNSSSTLNPTVFFLPGLSDRVSWDLGEGGEGGRYVADNSLSYTYPDGTTKTVVLRTNKLSNLNYFSSVSDNLVGNLDMSGWDNLGYFRVTYSPLLTSITHTTSTGGNYQANNCGLTGNHDVSMLSGLGGLFYINNNSSLTSITHGASTQTFGNYRAQSCNLTGNHDMSMVTGLSGTFYVYSNSSLTSITHGASTQTLNNYRASSCNLTGNHDMSMLPGLSGTFLIGDNRNLTSITHAAISVLGIPTGAFGTPIPGPPPPSPPTPSLPPWSSTGTTDGTSVSGLTMTGLISSATADVSVWILFGIITVTVDSVNSQTFVVGETVTIPSYDCGGCGDSEWTEPLTYVLVDADFSWVVDTIPVFNNYKANNCNLTGNHDMSMLSGLGGLFYINNNSSLTSITHTASTEVFSEYIANNCDLTGNHDMSMLPGLGGKFYIYSNPLLTGITHTTSTEVFSEYYAHSCNLTGNHDISMLPGLSGRFRIHSNPLLTSITHGASTEVFIEYQAQSCNLIGNHDVSMLSGLGGSFYVYSNPLLTGITHTTSTEVFTGYQAYDCDLTGNHDMSMLLGLRNWVQLYGNSALTGITFPLSLQTFRNHSVGGSIYRDYAFSLSDCDMGYSSFLPLSGATLDVNYFQGAYIDLSGNNMLASEVNHYLFDFNNLSTNLNPTGWSGVTLFIDGTNAAPDSFSGGYDGIAALSSLTGGTNNWIITTS